MARGRPEQHNPRRKVHKERFFPDFHVDPEQTITLEEHQAATASASRPLTQDPIRDSSGWTNSRNLQAGERQGPPGKGGGGGPRTPEMREAHAEYMRYYRNR